MAPTKSPADSAGARRQVPCALLELETGNFVGFYETERAALADVVDSIDRYGASSVDTLALAYSTPGDVQPIAEGRALAERALAAIRGQGLQEHQTNGATTTSTGSPATGSPTARVST